MQHVRPAARAATRTILEGTPVRALVFLQALGVTPRLRLAMAEAGYSDADHDDGWEMLHDATGRASRAPRDRAAADPLAPVLAWARLTLPRIRGALRASRSTPASLAGPADRTEEGSIRFVLALLKGFDHLDADTRTSLERRGFDRATRRKLAAAFAAVAKARPPAATPPPDRREALSALYQWLRAWTDVAHAHIERRDDLVRLGIARRRKR